MGGGNLLARSSAVCIFPRPMNPWNLHTYKNEVQKRSPTNGRAPKNSAATHGGMRPISPAVLPCRMHAATHGVRH